MVVRMREDRLKAIARDEGPKGPSRDMADLNFWSRRCSENSPIPPRAKGVVDTGSVDKPYSDPPKEHPTGKKMELRDTSKPPLVRRSIDARMVAKEDKNHAGDSSFMRDVRRIVS